VNFRALSVFFVAWSLAACSSSDSDPELDGASDALTGDASSLGSPAAGALLLTKANVNFRSAPKIANNVFEVIPNGTQVEAVGGPAQSGFVGVRFHGKSGFVSGQYLSLVAAPKDAGPPVVNVVPATPGGSFRVAYIGDSHSDFEGNARGAFGFLGQRVTELMAEANIPLSLYAASGSFPNWWLDDAPEQVATLGYTQTSTSPPRRSCSHGGRPGTCVPKLAAILADTPSLFVIEQGTNLLGRNASDITAQIQHTLQQISGKASACLWVGAPNARTSVHSQQSQDDLWRLIHDNASPTCVTYDSRFLPETDASGQPILDDKGDLIVDVPLPYSPDRNNDGEHFGMDAAGKWATGVAQMIESIRRGHK
jgi:hypothetical protein